MRSGALDLYELLTDIQLSEVECPDLSDVGPRPSQDKDLFAEKKRAAWKDVQTAEARCDFAPNRMRITNRGGVFFITLWKKSVYGRTLTDIKSDDEMVDYFADNIAPLVRSVLGSFLSPEDFAVVTTRPNAATRSATSPRSLPPGLLNTWACRSSTTAPTRRTATASARCSPQTTYRPIATSSSLTISLPRAKHSFQCKIFCANTAKTARFSPASTIKYESRP